MKNALLFVYNAKSGKLNAALDAAHKLLSPSSYDCQLCQITHGPFREKEPWKSFRKSSGLALSFLHKDEYERIYDKRVHYPVVLKQTDRTLKVLLSRDEIGEMQDATQLITRLREKLAK